MSRRTLLARVAFGIALLGFLGWQDGLAFFHTVAFQLGRGDTPRPVFNAAVYAAVYATCVAAIAALLLHPWRWLRWTSALMCALLASVHVGFAAVNGTGFGHHEASILWSELQFAPSALRFFAPGFALPVAITLAGWLSFAAWGSRLALRGGVLLGVALLALPLAAGLGSHRLARQTFGKVFQMPVPVRVPVIAQWIHARRVPYYGPRETPPFEPAHAPLTDHLVVVMDESISGHWLGANGAVPDTTPWLSSRPPGVFNYGIASAVANVSSTSNLLVQSGLRPDRLPDRELRALRGPSLFSYLGAAGFRTAFVDAQTYSDRLQNFMTPFDVEEIDAFRLLRQLEPGLPEHEVDRAALRWVEDHLRSAPHSFTYLVKNGAHLPYADKYPPEEAGSLAGPADRELLDYLQVVAWSADAFLRELAERLEASGEEVLVVYTSDHGQALDEPGAEPGRAVSPHATEIDPPSAQASVPLILLAFGERTRAAVAERFDAGLRDRVSGFEIFPTLLEAAGYARADLAADHAPSLFDADAPRGERVFVSGNVFAREGGFYVNNPGMGSACHLNRFEAPPPRRFPPPGPDASAGTTGTGRTEADTSPTAPATSST